MTGDEIVLGPLPKGITLAEEGMRKKVWNVLGDTVRMPRNLPHAYYNRSEGITRGLFWVSPAGKLAQLFDQLHNLTDPEEVVRRSALHDVNFLPPGSVEGA